MSQQDDSTRDSVQPHAERWAAESPFLGEAAEEQQTPVVDQWYQAHTPFREEQEPEEVYGSEAEEEDHSAELEDGAVYELIDEASERLYPERYSAELQDEEPDEQTYEPLDEAYELELYQEPLAGEDEYPVTQPAGTERLLQEHFESLVEEAKALLDNLASDLGRYDVAAMSEAEIEAFLDQYQPVGTQLPLGFEYLLDDVRDMAKRIFKGAMNLTELQTHQAGLQPMSPFHHAFEREQEEIVEPEVEEPWHWEYREPAEGANRQTLFEGQVGPTRPAIDVNRAVRENERYEKQLGWRVHYDRFTRLLRFTTSFRHGRYLAEAIADWQWSQRSQALTVDGIIGPETWLRMLTEMKKAGIWPRCVAPPVAREDPSALNVSPVGNLDYSGGTVTTSVGDSFPVEGTVFYPAERAGKGAPFNTRLAKQGPVPIVFIAHGMGGLFRDPNDPQKESKMLNPGDWIPVHSHKGHEYFQRLLAQMGIIAVSVDCTQINKIYAGSLWTEPIHQRADLILGSIRHFQSLNSGGDPIFKGRIDFFKVGLMGHSQGGEAAVVVPEKLAVPGTCIAGVTIKGVIALAPTDAGTLRRQPNGFAFMAIEPAGDGDVGFNKGAKFYDEAIPDPFKCQLYVHHANHNFFNTEWPRSDGHGPSVMLPSDHQRILSVYGCAFFREVLLGHSLVKFLKGQEVPPGVPSSFIHISFELKGPVTVDDHENRDININTLRQRTKQSGGLTAKEFEFAQRTGAFNRTFFGETIGMVAQSSSATGQFRSPLVHNTDLTGREIWIRAAEVYNGTSVPAGATGFKLGLEDSSGLIAFVDSDDVGALPRPYERRAADLAEPRIGQDLTKTMLKTLRFPTDCFKHSYPGWNVKKVCAVVLRLDRGDGRALAFDQLQIVKP